MIVRGAEGGLQERICFYTLVVLGLAGFMAGAVRGLSLTPIRSSRWSSSEKPRR